MTTISERDGTNILTFDSNKDNLKIQNITLGPSYTKSACIKLSSLDNTVNNIISGETNLGSGHALFIPEQFLSAGHNGKWDYVKSPYTWLDEWHHVAVSYNARTSQMKLYIDGTLVDSAEKVPQFKDNNIQIGGFSSTNQYNLTGSIKNAQVWNRVLSDTDIWNLYNGKDFSFKDRLLIISTETDKYDIEKEALRADAGEKVDIIEKLKESFLLKGSVDTSKGTKDKHRTVTAGWVFVNFKDVPQGDITALRNKLEGPKDDDGNSALEAFVKRESNGRVKLVVETYNNSTTDAVWVTLPNNHDTYKDKFKQIASEVDQLIEFPNHWEIAMFAFPSTDSTTSNNTIAYERIGRSQCHVDRVVDQNQKIQFTFIDPERYKDDLGAHITTIHELMHALGLPDLYYQKTNRSYGWSIMSAAGAGSHITQFEKLLLGWEDPENFTFLKNGIIPADDLFAPDTNKKGVIILPDSHREDTYFIEVAQEIGVGKENQLNFTKENTDGYGLLLMIMRKDGAEGNIIPFVSKRPVDIFQARNMYGGASKAPFKASDQFFTNGIFSYPAYYKNQSGNSGRIIGVIEGFKPKNQAKLLRENEAIIEGEVSFKLTTTGYLILNDLPLFDNDYELHEPYNLRNTDYGYVAFIDDMGVFKVAKGVNSTSDATMVLKTYPTPSDITLTKGNYFFKIDKFDEEVSVNVYKLIDEVEEYIYTLFKHPKIIKRSTTFIDNPYVINFNSGDGNIVILKDEVFINGTYQIFGATDGTPNFITFDKDGTMNWWKTNQTSPYKIFSSTTKGVGPFRLGINEKDGKPELVVKDSANKQLYSLVDYPISRGGRITDGDYVINFNRRDGNIVILKDEVFINGTYQIFGATDGTPNFITFDEDGTMKWWKTNQTSPYKIFSSTTKGVGPFRLGINEKDGKPELVVKDSANTIVSVVNA